MLHIKHILAILSVLGALHSKPGHFLVEVDEEEQGEARDILAYNIEDKKAKIEESLFLESKNQI